MRCLLHIFVVSVFCIVSKMSFATEYECNCKKYNGLTTSINGTENETTVSDKCTNIKPLLLEQEEGYLSMSLTNGSAYKSYDVIKETKSFVQAQDFKGEDNFSKLNFNKNSKSLRIKTNYQTEREARWNGDKLILPYSYFKMTQNMSFSCKKL